jgi:glucose/arabinose dehydrogenase
MKARNSAGLYFALLGGLMVAPSARAAIHVVGIEQVIGAVNGDKTAQAVQLRMLAAGQNQSQGSQLRGWDAAGLNPVLLSAPASAVPNSASGSRILFCTPNFNAHTTPAAVCDFTMTPMDASRLAAGSLTFESDGGFTIYWRLSWGGAAYTGTGAGSTINDSNGNFNPPFEGPLPVDCNLAVRYLNGTSPSNNNQADYDLTAGAATVINNAGTSFVVKTCGVGGETCDDGAACTTDACVSGCCTFTPDNGACPEDGLFCNGEEICSATLGCVSAGSPCSMPTPVCDDDIDMCVACDDPSDCDDMVACTDNACTGGSCVFTPNDGNCPEDGLFCNGPENCNAVTGCFSAGEPCTASQTCDEPTDTCINTALAIALVPIAGAAVTAGPGLSSPLQVTHTNDGSGRLFIVDQIGQIRVVDGGSLLGTPFLDISGLITPLESGYDERGLLGMAFHPQYSTNGRFFVRYSRPRTSTGSEPCDMDARGCHEEVLAEYAVLGDPLTSNVADATSETIILAISKPQWNHNAGSVAFSSDGLLHFGMGDGGGAHDGITDAPPSHGPIGSGQDPDTLLGKMLRIDVDSGSPYAIPPSNPFASSAGADEIYAMGFRNPYRFSIDSGTGDIYVADVGQNRFEEIDVVTLGGNYGWAAREGAHFFNPFAPNSNPGSCHSVFVTGGVDCASLDDPIAEYSHSSGGLAVVGGYVYRGLVYPDMFGMYVFGDFSADFGPTGRLYYLDPSATPLITVQEFHLPDGAPLGKVLKGFGEDEDGELYVCASSDLGPGASTAGPGGGVVYLIVPAPRSPASTETRTRALSLQVPPSAVASGIDGASALRVKMIDLENPAPPNNNPAGPCCPPGNFITFDTEVNSVCAGGNDQGYRCPPSACPGSSCPAGVGCTEVAGPEAQGECARWVGPPFMYLESNDNPGLGNYLAARIQCRPYYHDWATVGTVHVIGAEIVPSSRYELQAFSALCKGMEDTCTVLSDTIEFTTRRAGDISTPFQGGPPLTQPNAIDVTNSVNKFRNLLGSPPKATAQVQPNFPDPNADINAIDIVTVVDNQRGFGYTYSGPCVCPSTVPCNVTACAGASACTGPYGAGATCIKTCTAGPRQGQPCNNNLNCGYCIGGPPTGTGAAGSPCDANADCASGNCFIGVCPAGATPGFCRDRCGRCN